MLNAGLPQTFNVLQNGISVKHNETVCACVCSNKNQKQIYPNAQGCFGVGGSKSFSFLKRLFYCFLKLFLEIHLLNPARL